MTGLRSQSKNHICFAASLWRSLHYRLCLWFGSGSDLQLTSLPSSSPSNSLLLTFALRFVQLRLKLIQSCKLQCPYSLCAILFRCIPLPECLPATFDSCSIFFLWLPCKMALPIRGHHRSHDITSLRSLTPTELVIQLILMHWICI